MAIADAVCDRADERTEGRNALTHPKLKEADAVRRLCEALEGRVKKFLVSAFIQGETLWVNLGHPGIVQEFKREKPEILDRMRRIYRDENLSEVIVFRQVRAQFKSMKPKEEKEREEPDRAAGDFEILAKDAKLKKVFSSIRERIKATHHP